MDGKNEKVERCKHQNQGSSDKDQEIEAWLPILGYEKDYMISSLGRVKSIKRPKHLILKPIKCSNKYLVVNLWKIGKTYKRILIHRLVAMHFLDRIDGHDIVNHKNFDRTDNRARNLEWTTYKKNTDHAMEHGKMLHGDKCPASKLNSGQVRLILADIKSGNLTQLEISKKYGVTRATIWRIKEGVCWKRVTGL